MLQVSDLHFSHGAGGGRPCEASRLEAREGEITTVLGPNGCGKTTLFKCIGGLWKPQKGEVTLVRAKRCFGRSHVERARLLATVPQEHEAAFPYSVFDMVLMGRASRVGALSMPSRQDRQRADRLSWRPASGALRDKSLYEIERRRKTARPHRRALAQDAPVLLLDEPVSHLDFRHQLLILRKIKALTREKNLVTLMTLHDPNMAMLFSGHVVLMN